MSCLYPVAHSSLLARYQPFYCEENAWHLCQQDHLATSSAQVAVIASAGPAVALWAQRTAEPDAPVLWDYHVIVVAHHHGWHVWDPDTRLGMPVPLSSYLAATFATVGVQDPRFDPLFRIMPAAVYARQLRSDRSHMRNDDGTFKAPVPEWPLVSPLGDGTNLNRFVDMNDAFVGTRLTLSGVHDHLKAHAATTDP